MNMRKGFVILNVLIALIFLSGCEAFWWSHLWDGGDDGNWDIEDGIRIEDTTSSSTVRLSDGTYRTYLAGIRTATSADGLTWSDPEFLDGIGQMYTNPAILVYSDGTYILIFEEQYVDPDSGEDIRRFFRAQSADGVDFALTVGPFEDGAIMVPEGGDNNFLSVPDMIELVDGSIRMYFVASGDHIESALSNDKGMTWIREGVTVISDLKDDQPAVDPDIIMLDDGVYCLFFATNDGDSSFLENLRIRSALSDNGLDFELEGGDRIPVENDVQLRLDPDVVLLPDGNYRMYFGEALDDQSEFNLRSALSPD